MRNIIYYLKVYYSQKALFKRLISEMLISQCFFFKEKSQLSKIHKIIKINMRYKNLEKLAQIIRSDIDL